MISFFTFAWETAGADDNGTCGESLNKSSNPAAADWGLLSTGLAESFFSKLGTGAAAEQVECTMSTIKIM
jgi:hypothetical protein